MPLEELHRAAESPEDLLDLDAALTRLAAEQPDKARLGEGGRRPVGRVAGGPPAAGLGGGRFCGARFQRAPLVAAGALLLVLAGLALGDAAVSLPAGAGSEALEQVVLPTTQTLAGAFAPSSNQSWLTTGGAANGVVNLAFTQSTSTDLRSAQVTVLGQPINVFQAPPQVVANLAD